MDIKIAAEPLALLMAVLRERLGAGKDENLSMMRELLKEQLPDEAIPKPA